ncbi:hypothetical protein WR25_27039 [Diploscapter pachys]|uniref:Uncharacterized protein n=1 Tax=Diploscapter pachys TaxID=2018661 RepID=A0A2A2KCS1_9BILA|nr:hypothetical protein WR25_27039 [Diploscapter pachys]
MGGKTNLQSAFRSANGKSTDGCLLGCWLVRQTTRRERGKKGEAEGGIEGSKTWMDPQRDGMTRDRHWTSELERAQTGKGSMTVVS